MLNFLTLAILMTAASACSKQSKPPAEQEPALAQEEPGSDPIAEPDPESKLVWLRDLEEARALASQQERDLLIDFSAVWCAPCEKMEKTTFADAETVRFLRERFIPLKVDVTEQTDADRAMMDRFFVKVLPALLVVRGEEVVLAIDTYVGPKELQKRLSALPGVENSPK